MNHLNYQLKLLLPEKIQDFLTPDTEEIRFRRDREIFFLESNREIPTDVIADKPLLEAFLDKITKSSLYTYLDNIREGYITIEGGHRVGLAGTAVYSENTLSYLRDISSVNIRVSHEIKGVADSLFSILTQNKCLSDTLIISPPGCGKTTLLRDLTRLISDTIPKSKVVVIDERSELGATHLGEAQNDLGKRTDILNGYSKKDGIERAIRSLSPTTIITDEIGTPEDEDSILKAKQAGITVIATIHGDENSDFHKNIPQLTAQKVFRNFVFLSKRNPQNRIEKICHQLE